MRECKIFTLVNGMHRLENTEFMCAADVTLGHWRLCKAGDEFINGVGLNMVA